VRPDVVTFISDTLPVSPSESGRLQAPRARHTQMFGGGGVRVSDSSAPKPLNLQLWFGDVLVADLLNVFPHQGTWFARYRQVVTLEQGPLQARLCEFIRFSEAWHQRLDRGEHPNAREFEPFLDVLESAAWRVPCPDGTELRMAQGPGFVQGEASWNQPEAEPSREAAAWQVWSRLTRE
jgi:hypothetical protein